MLGVDERRDTAALLALGHDVQGHGGFAAGFGAEHLDDAALGDAADAQRQIKLQAAGGDDLHLHVRLLAQLHHGALAKLLFQGGQGGFQRPRAVVQNLRRFFFRSFLRHK